MPHHQPRDDNNNDQGSMRTTPVKGTQEVPATAPIFEGHLYLQHPEKSGRWQWRLFRFDGTSFTCLSTRKIKLPPDTPVDTTPNENTLVQSLSSHQLNQHQQHNMNHSTSFHTSHTSPLLATPKDKTLRLVSMTSASMPDLPALATTPSNNVNEPMLASYYQLPKWTVDIANISAISVLKGSKKRSPFSSNSSKSKCFCIRTYDGQCHVMKAQKYKDLERWLFVLTKMWRFVQTIRDQMQKQQQQQQQQLPVAMQPAISPYPPVFINPVSSWEQQQQPPFAVARPFDNTITARNLVPPPPPPPPPPHIHDNTIAPTTSSPQPQPPVGAPSFTQPHHHQHQQQQQSTQYDARYKAPMLSMEKVHWIDQWRESLAELAAYDQKAVSPPPIEPIPDDDQISSISGLTSISHRGRPAAAATTTAPRRSIVSPRRKASKRSIRSITASMKRVAGGGSGSGGGGHPTDGGTIKSNSIAPANASSAAIMPQELPLEDRPSSSLKKKRSDEVKNWITSNKAEEIVIVGPDMDYFQDANTVLEKEESVNADADYRAAVRYHTSIRGRNVQLVEEEEEQQQHPINERQNQLSHRASLIADEQIHGHSPLQTLARTDNPRALQQHINYSKRSSSPALMWQSSTTTQPLNTRGMDDDNNDDDDMSLADLQRSLRRVSVNDDPRQQYNRVRSPSASSILDKRAPLDLINNQRSIVYPQPHPSYYTPSSQHYSTQPLPPSTPSIVAPAVPPMPVGRCSTPSRPFYGQPTMSSSELTSTQSKKMYHYFDTQSSRTIATDAVTPPVDKKKRPQSWMIPSTTTFLDPKSAGAAAASPVHPSLKATTSSSNSNHDHYYTRRSIDVADTIRRGSTSSNRWS
ncbi:predicted protein [Lichtheimia corymbifera JMRC:FSU:9682]|uniref:PH domain-containing protein n=1 Tax=Lichtheimia corymbifera JMRC:FSU:9682 TaxID=1263082 RepID=A0A068S427_9FUNG|nr:predicted protein [Lichtheimia corymbifera JMRC:FSU:9682]